MKIQLINSSNLKIIFNKIDLEENNISIHSFLSRSLNSQKFIKAIIEIAYEDFGFKVENNNFLYEIYCFDFSEFIIIVSKNSNSLSPSYNPQNDLYYESSNISRDTNPTKLFSFKFKPNKLLKSQNLFFIFNKFEEFLEFSEYIKNSIKFKNINSSLYEYQNIFLLEIETSNLLASEFTLLLSTILEARTSSNISFLTLTRFKEFAKILYPENALNL